MIDWPSMSADEYAALERLCGAKLHLAGNVWWRRVRPFFYRPLLPLVEIGQTRPPVPKASWLGAVQYPVPAGRAGNSHLHYLVSEPAGSYSLTRLGKKDARSVRVAQKHFSVRRIELRGDLVRQAHATYLEFYGRTRYAYKSERQQFSKFEEWAGVLNGFPKLWVLGAFAGDRLRALSVSCRVDETVLYSTFFAANDALKQGVSDIMLHSVRVASATSGAGRVYATMFRGECGYDKFYLHRGFQIVSKPAMLRIHPLLVLGLQVCAPRLLAQMRGDILSPRRVEMQSASATLPVMTTACGGHPQR
jgi:hypothetical protein